MTEIQLVLMQTCTHSYMTTIDHGDKLSMNDRSHECNYLNVERITLALS